jgi:uncharacterized protein involved in type VI secretion and phage assembly
VNIYDVLLEDRTRERESTKIFGVVVGIVTNNQDPQGLGRVKVKFPWLSDEEESNWARIAALGAGGNRGAFFLPEVEDEVLVAFEQGDVNYPYVLGGLWNGQDDTPANNQDGENNLRIIRSRSGHVIKLNDKEGEETIEVIDKSNNNLIVIDTANDTITITSNKDIRLSAAQGIIKLDAQQIQLESSGSTKIQSGAGMDVKASATMNIQGATVNIN